ncbi:hypothetical protein [Limnohabitans sp.]|uniref:hypothetical protein n=1 Tax=Limnohabitans sp. TaxID=1907725 RepID=UPI0038B72F7C
MKNVYLTFLNLCELLQDETGVMAGVDLESKKLLEIIALKNSAGSPMKVMDAMRLDTLASPATIHRKLTQLVKAGLVEMIHQGTNRRKKFLIPTPLAEKYFHQIGEIMFKAVGAH